MDKEFKGVTLKIPVRARVNLLPLPVNQSLHFDDMLLAH